jgi:hypothetical protein
MIDTPAGKRNTMANIWQPPPGGFVTGPGLVCIGSLDADPDHPWGRTNPYAYDGAVYGYREIGDFGNIQYNVLGGNISVCNFDSIADGDKAQIVTDLNAGCNKDPFLAAHVLVPSVTDTSADPTWSLKIRCTTDGGTLSGLIKASMAVWGIVRDVMTLNDLGRDETPSAQTYGIDGGQAAMFLTFPTEAGNDLWVDSLVPEVIALWNEH